MPDYLSLGGFIRVLIKNQLAKQTLLQYITLTSVLQAESRENKPMNK